MLRNAFWLLVLVSSLNAANINLGCGNYTQQIDATLSVTCGGETVFFGLDVHNNPINPFPSGGSLILASAFSHPVAGGSELDLDFHFITGVTVPPVFQYSVEGVGQPAVNQFALGTNLPGFQCDPTGTQVCTDIPSTGLSGNFTITENVKGSVSVSITANQVFHNAAGALGSAQNPVMVTTNITNSSNLLGFEEALVVPEPGTVLLMVSGLLGVAVIRRRKI